MSFQKLKTAGSPSFQGSAGRSLSRKFVLPGRFSKGRCSLIPGAFPGLEGSGPPKTAKAGRFRGNSGSNRPDPLARAAAEAPLKPETRSDNTSQGVFTSPVWGTITRRKPRNGGSRQELTTYQTPLGGGVYFRPVLFFTLERLRLFFSAWVGGCVQGVFCQGVRAGRFLQNWFGALRLGAL